MIEIIAYNFKANYSNFQSLGLTHQLTDLNHFQKTIITFTQKLFKLNGGEEGKIELIQGNRKSRDEIKRN